MKYKLQQTIQEAFEAPQLNQQKKSRFLRTLPQPRISMFHFVLTQAAYMRKLTFVLSVLLLVPAVIGAVYVSEQTLWIVSAFVPVLGLLAVTESTRSTVYGMSEFEMSTRFSIRILTLSRMSILGLINFALIAIVTPLCRIGSEFSLLQTGMYLIVPYLFTVNFSLLIARRVNGKEMIYGCICVAAIVSGMVTGLHSATELIYQDIYLGWWLVLIVFLLIELIYEIHCTIKRTEEGIWNLSLTD